MIFINIEIFKAKTGIDPIIEAHYRFISSIKNTTSLHSHDFFELFIIIKGNVIHCVNERKQFLEEGSLVFIRDRDIHAYEQVSDIDCQFINLSFYKKTLFSVFDFLGEGFPKNKLLNPALPPVVTLSTPEKEYIRNRLDNLNLISSDNKLLIKAEVKSLLVELLSRYIMDSQIPFSEEQPLWFNSLLLQMSEKNNFTEGVPALIRLSGKTHSHICRLFKKHLDTTPNQYVNKLRLQYAENLLLNTSLEIIEICLEAGFENLSNFYKHFKEQFNTTPHQVRMQSKKFLYVK